MRKIPIHFLLFSVFPILFLFEYNKEFLYFSNIIKPLVLSVTFGLSFFLLSLCLFKKPKKSAVITSLFVMLFFSFGHLLGQIYPIALDLNLNISNYYLFVNLCYGFLFSVLGIILLLGIFFTIKSKNNFESITLILNIIAFFLVLYSVFSITSYSLKNKIENQQSKDSVLLSTNSNNPDIYHIILDGYGRQDVLDKYYGFDNSNFIADLQNVGFFIANKGRSNYAQTYLSLSSTLNQQYIDIEQLEIHDKKSDDRGPYKKAIKTNVTIQKLREKGYKIAVTPTSGPVFMKTLNLIFVFQE